MDEDPPNLCRFEEVRDAAIQRQETLARASNLYHAEPCGSPACLAYTGSLEREIRSLKQEILSLQAETKAIVKSHEQQTSCIPSTHHSNLSNTNLASTLVKERENFEQERQSWASFKRDYATKVMEKLNDLTNKLIDQPKHQLPQSSLHPLLKLVLETNEQQKRKVSEFFQTQTHLPHSKEPKLSQKLSVDNPPRSKPASFIQNDSVLVSPGNSPGPPPESPTRQTPRFQVRKISDLVQQSTSESIHPTPKLVGSPHESPAQVSTDWLHERDPDETRGCQTPVQEVLNHSLLNPHLSRFSCHKSRPGEGSPKRNGPSPNKNAISPYRNGISPTRNGTSPKRNGISSRINRVSPSRNAISPSRNSISPRRNRISTGRNGMSPARKGLSPVRKGMSPARKGISPGKKGISPGRNGNVSAFRPNQLSLRLKPHIDESANKGQQITPQLLRKRSVSSVASRPKLPTPKWIRYSDRKARAGKVIWDDREESLSTRTKLKKSEPDSSRAVHDIFKVNTKQNAGLEDVTSKLDNLGKQQDTQQLEPSSEDLPTTEESESETESTCLENRISTPAKPSNKHKNYSSTTAIASNSKTDEKMKEDDGGETNLNLMVYHEEEGKTECTEDYPGQNYLRKIHQERRRKSIRNATNSKRSLSNANDDSVGNIHDQFEINPNNNFGVKHVFDEVARGKLIRKNMRARDCECCSGYYEQAAKDLNPSENRHQDGCSKIICEHQHQISRHRHFNPPPTTPPNYWQMGFPDTQEVEKINQRAESNKKMKLKNIELQARDGTGPYKFKENPT